MIDFSFRYLVRRAGAVVTSTSGFLMHVLKGMARVCLLFVLLITPGWAAQVVLDEVQIKDVGQTTVVDVLFGLPLEYIKHFPQKAGEIVQIQLRLESKEQRALHKEVREGGELHSPAGKDSVLVYVTYEEGVPGGPYLTLRFTQQVTFEVTQGVDRKSLRVIVERDEPVPIPKMTNAGSSQTGQAKKTKSGSIDLMMAKARQAITFGDNKGAINLLRKIIRAPKSEHTRQANELLGLALERDKQIPRAKFEYKKYLKRYPEGEGTERVKQRLASLRDLRIKAKRKLRRSKTTRRKNQFITFGRFTQAYSEYYLDRDLDPAAELLEEELQQQLLSTHFSVKSRYRGKNRTVQGIFNASHRYDFLAGNAGREDDDKSEGDIRRMYLDVDDRVYGYMGRFGRQTSRNGGVFGTFDGAIAGYHLRPRWMVSVMAGKPVIRTFNDAKISETVFYGIKADVESADKKLGSNQFFVQQEVDGILDRQAVGGDVRYAQKGLSIFGLVDYDVMYGELSLLNVRIGWSYAASNKLNFSYNRRNLMLTSRALNGMTGIATIDELRGYLSESEIRRIAKERTTVNETLTIGNTYQLSKTRQINTDITLLQTSGIPEGINPLKLQEKLAADPLDPADPRHNIDPTVFGSDSTGLQFIYSLQLIASNTFVKRDLYVLGLRRSDFDTYSDTSAFINARIPLYKKWRTGLRMNVSKRDSASFGKRTTISPVVKFNYRLSRAWSFDSDIGMDFVDNVGQPDEVRRRMRLSYSYTF